MAGAALLGAAEFVLLADPALADILSGSAAVLLGVSLLPGGVAVLRAGRWSSWRRFVPRLTALTPSPDVTGDVAGGGEGPLDSVDGSPDEVRRAAPEVTTPHSG